jgi:hypothetical protein
MSRNLFWIIALASSCVVPVSEALASEAPLRPDVKMERLVLDDGEDASVWYNGSPEETTVSCSSEHVKQGRFAIKFANVVDHTKGEKNYPVGWPRTGKDLAKVKRTDWSAYDFFECWICAKTSRESLPKVPLAVGFYHSGPKQSTHIPLKQVKKDAWVKIVIPVGELAAPQDVQRVQFNISEADYKHGDQVEFYIDDMVLTRFATAVVAELLLSRSILYANDSVLTAAYRLAGRQAVDDLAAEFALGRGSDEPVARVQAKASRQGEVSLTLKQNLAPGMYWARLGLRDARGQWLDQKTVELRVIAGPFE